MAILVGGLERIFIPECNPIQRYGKSLSSSYMLSFFICHVILVVVNYYHQNSCISQPLKMAAARRPTPIIVGVGDIKNRSMKIEDAIEPMQLMLQAILKAMQDTNLSASATKELQSKIDSVGVVNTWTWVYPDLPRLISEKLDVKPKYQVLSHHGGDSPAKLFDQAARRISLGESKVAIMTGGEALASCKFASVV
jgi:hypothetical protein